MKSPADSSHRALSRALMGELLLAAFEVTKRPVPAGPIIEFGPGTDSFLDGMPDLGRLTIAADLSGAALRALRDAHHRPLRVDAGRPLPFGDETIAVVVAADLVEHLFDPVGFLGEVARVIRPDGVLVVSTPNLAKLANRVHFLVGRSPHHVDPSNHYSRLHIRPMTLSMLCGLLDTSGFDEIEALSNLVGVRIRKLRFQSRWLALALPSLGDHLIVGARRTAAGNRPPTGAVSAAGGRPRRRFALEIRTVGEQIPRQRNRSYLKQEQWAA